MKNNMETAKQKAIREAYGEYWEQVSKHVNSEGWCDSSYYSLIKGLVVEFTNHENELGQFDMRPKSLSGIENNNGWIKIESEYDLPKNFCSCWVIVDGVVINTPLNYNPRTKQFNDNVIFQDYKWFSHYQPVEKLKGKPIY